MFRKLIFVAVVFAVGWVGWQWKPFQSSIAGMLAYAGVGTVAIVKTRKWAQ